MNLREVITAKNSGFPTKTVNVPEWNTTVTVREPLHTKISRYAKSINNILENEELTEDEMDIQSIKAEAILFVSVVIDDNGDLIFNNDDIEDLIKCYGPNHTRIVNEALSLVPHPDNPIKGAEKK